MDRELFIIETKKLGIDIDEEQLKKLDSFYDLLIEWNNKINLTTITKKEDVYLKHFYDSLTIIKAVDLSKTPTLCDVGTGAGFPGIVLAIINSSIEITLVESNNKKCTFLEEVSSKLKLENVSVINSRMEDFSRKNIEKYDLITCRAVTSIPIILELSSSALKINGLLVPLKSNCEDEIKKYKYLEKELNIKLIDKIDYNLPINNASRSIPIYKKIGSTSKKYPRNYNVILNSYKSK
jgi:16S rRNA (guanine527-N7)-methyltransferase